MQYTQQNSVAIIYRCKRLSEQIIRNRPKLQRRLQRAIEDMVEDGMVNFILPIECENTFITTVIDAIEAEKRYNVHIRLTMLLPYERGGVNTFECYVKYADDVIYNRSEYICGEPTGLLENLIAMSSASILYCEESRPLQLLYLRRPLVYINL